VLLDVIMGQPLAECTDTIFDPNSWRWGTRGKFYEVLIFGVEL